MPLGNMKRIHSKCYTKDENRDAFTTIQCSLLKTKPSKILRLKNIVTQFEKLFFPKPCINVVKILNSTCEMYFYAIRRLFSE